MRYAKFSPDIRLYEDGEIYVDFTDSFTEGWISNIEESPRGETLCEFGDDPEIDALVDKMDSVVAGPHLTSMDKLVGLLAMAREYAYQIREFNNETAAAELDKILEAHDNGQED